MPLKINASLPLTATLHIKQHQNLIFN